MILDVFFIIAPISVLSLQESSVAVFTLNCSSSGSPPTNVTWIKDGEMVAMSGNFTTKQDLRDGVTARYDNILTSSLQPSEVLGTYICLLDNLVSAPSEETLTLQGKTST